VTGRIGRLLTRLGDGPPATVAPAPCLPCQEQVAGRPTPVAPVPGLTAGPDDVLIPAADTLAVVIDGNLVVLEAASGRGVLLNASAALILTAFDGTVTVAQVVDQLAEETGMDAALLRADVRGTVDRLLAQGFVTIEGHAEAEAADADDLAPGPPLDPQRWRPTIDRILADVAWELDSGPRALAATSVTVRSDDAVGAEHLRQLLSSLPPVAGPSSVADHLLSIVSGGAAGRFRIVLDGRVISRVDTSEAAVAHALHHLDELAVEGSAAALLFHAGAVERDGRVVAVLGVSGQGKSTVTAALVQRGFRYLSDEVVAVDVATREVRPYPKALDLQLEALDLLGVDAGAASVVLPGSKVKVLPDRLGEVGTGGKPALLVFLADRALGGSEPEPSAGGGEPVPPAEALVAILPVTFQRTIATPGQFESLAELCEATPSIRIERAPLATMLAAIEAALAVAAG
jgi:hypothetical protein